jgi:hypothetical protein
VRQRAEPAQPAKTPEGGTSIGRSAVDKFFDFLVFFRQVFDFVGEDLAF